MRQTLSLFLLLCLLVGQACADERVTLRLADQKGNCAPSWRLPARWTT